MLERLVAAIAVMLLLAGPGTPVAAASEGTETASVFKKKAKDYKPAVYHGQAREPKSCARSNPIDKDLDIAFENTWDGNCYSCPKGCKRNLKSPNSGKQCSCPPRVDTSYSKAEKHEKARFLKCPKGQFLHTFNRTCYSCPKGYKRTTKKISSSKACLKRRTVKASTENWVRRGNKVQRCPEFARTGTMNTCSGSSGDCDKVFFDPRKGGECWSCPKYYHRTVHAVTDGKACIQN